MNDFEPFDEEFNFDKSILTESFPDYMLPSIQEWVKTLLVNHKLYRPAYRQISSEGLVLPLNRSLRKSFRSEYTYFINDIQENVTTFRNVISYLLQKVANKNEGLKLDSILSTSSSAYSVSIVDKKIFQNGIGMNVTRMKLVYRVPPIVKEQALEVMRSDQLLAEAWESHYGTEPSDEITVTRCTDAVAGLLRDKYFPDEKRSQLGTLIGKLKENPDKYELPANSLYGTKNFLDIMKDFSKIRGNHQSGTGRKPTHEEAGFVLHFSIMLYQLFRSKQ